ncbi:MAG: DUF4340 domain-containing protein [Gammaproteobacteria bacterium]|nr:DUF4340 domain-containing protein [Gammaproteobacteria bacterium]
MNGKRLAVIALTLVLVGVAWKVSVDKAPQTEVQRSALSAGLMDRVNDVTRVELRDGQRHTTLEREGDGWRVASQDGFPANTAAVRRLLLQLAGLETVEPKTSLPESYGRIGVADPGEGSDGLLVEVWAGDKNLLGLIVGHARDGGPQDQRYVRRAGEAQSWLVNGKIEAAADPISWLDARIVDVDTARVRRVTLTPVEGPPVVVSKSKPEDNFFALEQVPVGKEPRSKALVSSLGAALLDLRFNAVANAARIADGKPRGSALVETFDGLKAQIELFEKDAKTYARFHFEQDPTAAPAPATVGAKADTPEEAANKPADDTEKPKETVAEEVKRLADKTADWAYVLPDYKLRLLAKRLDDLVQAPIKKSAGSAD